jgi:serine/threonine-protein kinase HipA
VADIAVFNAARRVGTIEPREGGAAFAYDPDWLATPDAFPISLQIPLAQGHAAPGAFERWAAALLPQSLQLHALAGQLGKAQHDTIGILERVGRDTAGALSFAEPGGTATADCRPVVDATALEHLLDGLPQKPLAAGEDGVSATLPGTRTKLPVALDLEGRICLPRNGTPSTHILKPDTQHLFGGVQNEALCMVLARRCGLEAPVVTTGRAGGRAYLLVARYDRIAEAGAWCRMHQESFTQATGQPESLAAEPGSAAGTSLAELLTFARRVMCAPDVLRLIDRFILDVLLCNPAPPGSNIALVLTAAGPSLAPVYGLASMAAWDGIAPRLERMITGEAIDCPHWLALAGDCGLNAARLLARVEALSEAVLANTREAAEAVATMPAGSHPLLARLVVAIEARARRHRAIAERYASRRRHGLRAQPVAAHACTL